MVKSLCFKVHWKSCLSLRLYSLGFVLLCNVASAGGGVCVCVNPGTVPPWGIQCQINLPLEVWRESILVWKFLVISWLVQIILK